jgi:hypothetical protein
MAGTSAGAKKGWASRKGGRKNKTTKESISNKPAYVGKTKLIAGKSSVVFKGIKKDKATLDFEKKYPRRSGETQKQYYNRTRKYT